MDPPTRRPGRVTRDNLIAEHADSARRIALRVARRTPEWVSRDDLVAASLLGLAEAADRFDPERGQSFPAFAAARISGAVLDELRRGDLMPRRVRQRARQVKRTIRELEQRHGRRPETMEIAVELGVSVDEYRHDLQTLADVTMVELDRHAENLSADASVAHEEVERAQLSDAIHRCLRRLPERDAAILSLRHMDGLSYAEIGRMLGLSESRVCQLRARAVERLRAEMAADERRRRSGAV